MSRCQLVLRSSPAEQVDGNGFTGLGIGIRQRDLVIAVPAALTGLHDNDPVDIRGEFLERILPGVLWIGMDLKVATPFGTPILVQIKQNI